MKNYFFMDCHAVMDTVYMSDKTGFLPILTQIQLETHLLFCNDCAERTRNFRRLEEIMKSDFLPPSPHFEDLLMERLYEEGEMEEKTAAPAGFSLLCWILIGFFVLLSLSTSFFGMNFGQIAASEGLSFLLPVGITIGVALTGYGAFFIGSHLKQLSELFRLR